MARESNDNNKSPRGGGTVGSSTREKSTKQSATRSRCMPSHLAAARVWSIGHHLMGLLATGMVSNLAKRRTENEASRYLIVGHAEAGGVGRDQVYSTLAFGPLTA